MQQALLSKISQVGARTRFSRFSRFNVCQYSASRNLSDSDRIHSTDIAFKPSDSGWGFTNKYNKNFENIFGKVKQTKEVEKQKINDKGLSADSSKKEEI